jgi:hypothetical protein
MEDLDQFYRAGSPYRKTHLERIVSVIPLHYHWACSIFGGLIFLAYLSVLLFFEKSIAYIEIVLILSVLISWQAIAIFWAHNKIRDFRNTFIRVIDLREQEIVKLYGEQEAIIFNDKGMIATGFAIVILSHILGVDQSGLSFQSFLAGLFVNGGYYLNAYITGVGLYAMIMTAFAVHKVGYLPLHTNILISENIQAIGILYSKFTIIGASVYILWILFHMSTPSKFSSINSGIWFSSFAFLLIGYFIFPQYRIHQIMAKTKREKLENFSSKMRVIAEETFQYPNEENISHLKEMLNIQHQMDEMCEWPFRSYEILHIGTIIAIPLIALMLEMLYDTIR